MTADFWRDAPVLVTGARGFIANHLCRCLIELGAIVHGTSRQKQPEDGVEVRWIASDMTDADEVRSIVGRVAPRSIFHLAGHVTGSQLLAEVRPTFTTNLVTTLNLLTAAADGGQCRVVLMGSMQEPDYAASGDVPCSPYAVSKWASTGYARMFHALYGLPVVVARPMMVYGPGQWDSSKLLPYVITSLLQGVPPAITSGARSLDWVFVEDVVDGLIRAATCGAAEGRAVDFGSGDLTSIRDLANTVCELIGISVTPRFGALPDRPFEQPRAARVAETQALLGWTATTSLRDGLQRTIGWHRDRLVANGFAASVGS